MQHGRTPQPFASADPLAGGGEMGALMRATDWASTPVGPVASWPQSLRTALSILLDTGFPMYIAWGPEFTQFYNDGYRPILGSTKHPALGKSTRETFKEIWHIIGPMFAGVMEGRTTTVVDFLLPLDRHGFTEECYFIFSYSPIRQEQGEVGGVLVTVTETTERVLGSRRLKTLQDLADRTRNTDSPEDACAVAAAVLRENTADIPFAAIYLLEADGHHARLAGASNVALETPAAAPRVAGAASPWPLQRVASQGRAEVIALDADLKAAVRAGDAEPACALVLPVTPQGAESTSAVLVAGVSPRLMLDEAYRSFLALVADHIGTAIAGARALQEAHARARALAELDRAKTVFFGNVSHEFRTPLTLMLGPTEAALRSPDQALRGTDLQVVHRNELRLLKLVNTLLDFSRIEAGRLDALYERTDIGRLTADLASVFRSATERAGLRLEIAVGDVPADVWVDRDMWEKIVLNLVSNGFKHTFEGGIRVEVRGVGDGVELTVADTGVGIAADQLPRIFERFHRVPAARARTHEGTGIGLALVQELVRLHGGTVSVESAVDRGTTFRVTLPTGSGHLPSDRLSGRRTMVSSAIAATAYVEEALRWLPETADLTPPVAPADGAAPGERSSSRHRILVVDDNSDMRAYVAALLGREFDVETAVDGLDALERFRARRPDLVLTDIMMPRLDGLGLLAAIRADSEGGQTPVVLVSARAGEEARIEGLDAGADDYLVKPFSARELAATVRAHVRLAAYRREFERRERALERKAAEAAAELERILSSVEEGIAAVDRDLRYIYLNPAAERLSGLRKDEVLGRTPWEVFPREVTDVMIPAVERSVATSRMVEYELYVPDTDRWYENRVYPASSGSVSVFFTDITGRKHSEEALARARDAAESANRLKDQFLATLSHELRTPLNAILGYARMLRQDVIPAERRRRVLEIIERNAMAQTQLIEDLLDISRISTGKLHLQLTPVPVETALQEALESLRPAADAKRITVEARLGGADTRVNADAVRLRQVFWNLLSNAVKFTPAEGRIAVALAREDDRVAVAITDSGVGIAPAFLPHVFEPFRQADGRYAREHGGIGLGLAICRQLVELHGGSIDASSEGPGRGATFTVRLPVAG